MPQKQIKHDNMKRNLLLILLVLVGMSATRAQSYNDAFFDALNSNDLETQRRVLAEWQEAAPNDVDLYIARYNFHANQTFGTIGYVEGTDDEMDVSVSFDNYVPAFSFHSEAHADSALNVITEAIGKFPNRLDLRFGKIYFLGQLANWDAFADEIIATLDRSQQIDHLWTYPNMDGGMVELLSEGVLDYQNDMLSAVSDLNNPSAEDTAMFLRMRRVAKRMVQLFPSDLYSVNILATTYTIFQEYDTAMKYLLRAEKIDPNDPIVLKNIVDVYTLMGKKKLAKPYQSRLDKLQEQMNDE